MIEEQEIKYLLFRINSNIKEEDSKDELFKTFNEDDEWRTKIYNDIVSEIEIFERKIADVPTSIEHAIFLYNAIEDYIDHLTYTTNFCHDVLKRKYGDRMLEPPLSILYVALVPFLLKVESFKDKLERFIPNKMLFSFDDDWSQFFPNKTNAKKCLEEMQKIWNIFTSEEKDGKAKNKPHQQMRKKFQTYASKSKFDDHYEVGEMIAILQKYGMDLTEKDKNHWVKSKFPKEKWVNE